MIATHKRVLVRVNLRQKDVIRVGDMLLKMAPLFETNHREKQPVLAMVVQGNKIVKDGDIIVTHHNHFSHPSPYFLMGDLYSIPFNKTIFGVFDLEGNLSPICGNLLAEYIFPESSLTLPEQSRKPYPSCYKVLHPGDTGYLKDDIVFTRPSAGYQIVYHWNNIEKRILKIDAEQICGVLLS
jgi:hypothetical protein